MLSCQEMSELASELLEERGHLSQRIAARWHFMTCGHCRRYLRQLRLTIGILRGTRFSYPLVRPESVLSAIDDRVTPCLSTGEVMGAFRGDRLAEPATTESGSAIGRYE